MNDEALAYFITWTCYGTFLPGDDRGWTKWQKGQQLPQPRLEDWCRDQMSESALRLNADNVKLSIKLSNCIVKFAAGSYTR